MADLILDARIASLEASLLKVQDLLGWATRRQQCLDKMNKLLQDSRNDLRRSYRSIDRYVHPQMMDAQERGSVPEDLALAAKAIEALNRLTGQLESGQKELVPLSKFSAQISGRGAAREIQSQFKKNAMDLRDSLQHLDRADPQVWQKYEKDVRASAQGLFAAFSEFLAGLLRAQWHDRQESALDWRIRRANLPERWSLETFPYARQPGVNRKQIRAFAELDFVAKHENLVFVGAPGVGKTGLACGLLLKALQNGYRCQFVRAQDLFD